ncbi:hypothetical protein SAE02_15890 [Skermanella aerolata]|uniref:EF-hand domain-containing protein n=1 Tax=Skermanella aerolata TaxID=393310 RepID=A0A512DLT6_9PROT|nr:hypothetical protein [Skermanella aerolata]KJB96291.1 hypothetical protein N826_35420 [Skermanella aerolata KACC 11604]GEO37441.1 hypothetical protein SAE02_15890 [Skermanella aerolata]
MVGTLETLSQNLVASLNATRVSEALTTAHPAAKAAATTAATATAATLQQAATPAPTTRTSDRAVDRDRERDRARSADPRRGRDNDNRVTVQLSAAATRLTQSGDAQPEPAPAAVEMLRSLRRARDAKQEGPMDEAMKKVREDLVKVFRMFGKSEKEALAAAEAVTGKARDASTRGPMGTRPSAGGEASTNVSVVFQSVTLQVSGESGKVQASIEIVRMEASVTTGAALAAGLPGGNQPGGAGQIPGQAQAPGGGGAIQQVDPLVFDLDGNGVNLSSVENGVYFDMDADGTRDKTAWVSGGDALLALDRNGNGRIDDGSELFGEQNGARDGFAELARFDQDGSGSIDAKDNIFNSLILLHADGGMSRLRDEGITGIKLDIAIGLKAPAEQQRLDGGVIASQSEFSRTDGSRGTVADVLFDVKV